MSRVKIWGQIFVMSLVIWSGSSVSLWANGQQEPRVNTKSQVPTKTVIKILVPASTSAIPFFWLAEKDPLAGIDIQTEVFISHPKALAELLLGKVELLLTGTTQGWNNYLDKSPLVIINTGVWGLSYLVGKDEGIKSFADLKGKRIALPFPGAPLDFQTKYLLEASGLKVDDVQVLYAPFTQAIPLLLSDQLDCTPLPEPLATEVVRNKGLKRLLDYKVAWAAATGSDGFSPQVSLFMVATQAKERRELFSSLVEAWRIATEEVQHQPEQMSKKYAGQLGISSEVLAIAIAKTLYFVPSFPEHKQRLNSYFSLLNHFMGTQTKELGEDFFFKN